MMLRRRTLLGLAGVLVFVVGAGAATGTEDVPLAVDFRWRPGD